MNLEDLIKSGALISSSANEPVLKTVKWDGKEFDVKIKRDMSAADFEYVIKEIGDEDSRMARRVHRLVYLAGGERIPYQTALQFKTSLLVALIGAINEVHQPVDLEAAAPKKTLRQKKSSGTS